MRTIAITIDEVTLRALDERAAQGPSRSHLVRLAVQAWLRNEQRERDELRESAVLDTHAELLNRQAAALIADQDEP